MGDPREQCSICEMIAALTVKIHHISCGTLCPYGGRLVSGEGGWTGAKVVCHCLLIETADSLVLVDTGMGLEDFRHPYRRLGIPFTAAFRPTRVNSRAAVEHVRGLGLDPADVRHIACTHLDLDHAGGLPDFPGATVHALAREYEAAVRPSLRDRPRYPRCHFAHGPKWQTHEAGGDDWFGFESIRVLPGVDPEILLIPLPGHSRGHTGIAVREDERWLLHCGDAYFNRNEIRTPSSCPVGLGAFQKLMAADAEARTVNQERLRELARSHAGEVRLFCAHDPVELELETVRTRDDTES
jgi:glyoxylase-like metal-dependent hydrolase (beta-lactamase superfamily II)